MSQYFEVDGMALWNPSNGASKLFLRYVALFEEELGLPSGIGPMENDEAQISVEELEPFVAALLAWRGRTNHAVMTALADGFIATLLVLAGRAGVEVRWPEPVAGFEGMHDVQVPGRGVDGWELRVREQARELSRFMVR